MAGYFPTITSEMITPFQALIAQLAANPKVLDDPTCPYGDEIKSFVKRLSGMTEGPRSTLTPEDLEAEVTDLMREAKNSIKKLDSGIDAKDRMAILRGQGQLIEKLIELKERLLNLKHVADFKRRIVDVMDSVLTPAQRTEFVTRLGDTI